VGTATVVVVVRVGVKVAVANVWVGEEIGKEGEPVLLAGAQAVSNINITLSISIAECRIF
jgi:hypothetical protein